MGARNEMRGAICMTWHYIAGELSLLLGEMQDLSRDEVVASKISNLRKEVETAPLTALADVAFQSLELANEMCRHSLALGDSQSFVQQLVICHELWCFGVSAGLLTEE